MSTYWKINNNNKKKIIKFLSIVFYRYTVYTTMVITKWQKNKNKIYDLLIAKKSVTAVKCKKKYKI